MKRFILFIIPALLIAGSVGCSDGGGKMPLLGFGSLDTENMSVPMKHMEYYYDNENGKRLNDMAVSGIPDSEDFRARLNDYMSAPLVQYLATSDENTASVNWWEQYDVDAVGMTEYLNSGAGHEALDGFLGAGVGGMIYSPMDSRMSVMPAMSVSVDLGAIRDAIGKVRDMTVLAVEAYLGNYENFVELNSACKKLDAMHAGISELFELTLFRLNEIEEYLRTQPLTQASNTVSAKMESFANMDGYDMNYRRDVIKDYFTSEHEVNFQQAYTSALEIAAFMNERVSVEKVPGNMLLSHMVIMRKMSELRFAYAPVFYTGTNLLRFNANWARSDLRKLEEIKDALLSDDNPARNEDYFNEACALLASWEIVLRSHIELYYGSNPTQVTLEDPENMDDDHAFGTFGDLNDIENSGKCGETLVDSTHNPIMGLFSYGDSLAGIFDEATSGDLGAGRSIRMVHKGQNLLSDLGLVPVAKSLVSVADMAPAPGKNQFFIDPALGRYILPRPDYWSRMGSEAEILTPVIGDGTTVFQHDANYFTEYDPGIWGNCLRFRSASRFQGTNYLHPFGSGNAVSSGTVSAWTKMSRSASFGLYSRIHFGGPGNYIQIQDGKIVLYVNATNVQEINVDLVNTDLWHHVYLVWDRNGGLSGSLRLRLFIDGVHQLSTSGEWDEGGLYLSFFIDDTPFMGASIYVENLKFWKHVVTEDPAFEWNDGAGRENALHAIYGPDADPAYDYRPKLTGPDGGVGYYYMP